MKKILNEYDETKKMLNTLRNLASNSRTLNEQYVDDGDYSQESDFDNSNADTESDVDNVNDVDVNLVSSDNVDLALTDQQRQEIANLIDSFREQVSQTANLEPGFTFITGQGRLDGVIQEFNLKFVFIAGQDSGVYINSQMLKLDNETVNIIEKLVRFQEQFVASIDTMLRERDNN